MGYVPGTSAAAASATSYQAPAPPKPQTFADATLAAMDVLEKALALKVARVQVTPELEGAWKTYQGIKARALRPGTDAEGDTATKMALKRLLDLVF